MPAVLHDRVASEQRRAAARHALRYQLEIALGVGRHTHTAPWALDREPYHHILPPWGLPEELELPEDEREPGARAPGAAPSATTPRPAAARPAPGIAPETLSWSWLVSAPTTAILAPCVTTPPIPWPFRIVAFSARGLNAAHLAGNAIQLFLTDEEQTTIPVPAALEPLVPLIGGGPAPLNLLGIPIKPGNDAGTLFDVFAAGIIGRSVAQGGRRILIAVHNSSAENAHHGGHLTVERWDGAADLRQLRNAPARTVAPARATAAAAPAPARIRPAYGPDPSVGLIGGGRQLRAAPGRIGFAVGPEPQNYFIFGGQTFGRPL